MEPATAAPTPMAEERNEEDSPASSPTQSLHEEKITSQPDSTSPATSEESEVETPKMAHDSMVTVRLSEPPSLSIDTTVADDTEAIKTSEAQLPEESVSEADTEVSIPSSTEKRASTASTINPDTKRTLQDELAEEEVADKSHSSLDQEEVDWAKLEQTEDEQTKDDETDNVGYQPNPLLRHAGMLTGHPCSPPPFSYSDSSKKTQNWLRTRRPSKSELQKKLLPPIRGPRPWRSYDRW